MSTKRLYSVSSTLFFFLIWEIIARYLGKQYILPWPSGILKFIFEYKQVLFLVHLPYTMLIMSISLLFSFTLGFFLAVLMDRYKWFENMIYPLIITTQTIPIIAIAPIFILWFGYSIWSKITVAILMIIFPIIINFHEALQNIKREYIELFKSMRASEKEIFFKLKIPTILPNILSSLKIAIPLSLIGASIGEWLGAERGLGYFSKRMMTQLNGFGIFAPILILSVYAILLVNVIKIFEKKYIIWRGE